MIRHITLVVLGLVPAMASAAAADAQAYLPVKPAELLSVLPPAPADWKLSHSSAETSFGQWHETRASRKYEAPVDATGKPGGSVDLSVVDTGGFRPALAAFASFKAEKLDGFEKVFLGSIPAIHFQGPNGERSTQALVDQRYLVEIQIQGLPQHTSEAWLRTLKFRALPTQGGLVRVAPPKEVRLAYVDELKPANNRAYSTGVTNAAALENTVKKLPQLPEPASR